MIVKDAAKTSLVVKDYLGSSRAVDQNNTMQVEEYYPYGADVKDMDIDVDRKFTGHRELDDAGVYHAGARFYNQELGIFVQADKVEGPNRYGYVQGNPISYNDPTGNSPNGTFAKISEFFEGSKPYFPHALPLQDSRYQDLYSDRSLPRLATYYSNRNPYDPQKNTGDFIRYLTRDIYESSPYNEDLIEVWDKQDAVKSGIDFYKNLARSNTRTNLPISDEINQLQQSGIKYKQEESKYRSERNAMSLGERIQKNKAICSDFTAFTGYVLAQNGIANAMGSTSDMHHAFGLVYLDEPNIPYVYDTTWSGYVENFYDDRMGNNEYQRSYKHWDFVTPWGNPFDFALHNETPAETNDGLEPFY
jgi:RHS repeat-associated protein